MTITIKYFGLIADITQKKEEQFSLDSNFIKSIRLQLEEKYPELKNTSFSIAVNQNIISDTLVVNENDEIALLPPFAGG